MLAESTLKYYLSSLLSFLFFYPLIIKNDNIIIKNYDIIIKNDVVK